MAAYPEPQSATTLRLTPQEYLRRERQAEMKSEYHAGVLVAMAGASPEHNRIVFSLSGALSGLLGDGDCRGFASDMRVSIPDCERYFYPDLTIVCGEPLYEESDGLLSLINPTLIIEVLSDSTEARDRGEKWQCYQTLESLAAYVLVTQHRPQVEAFQRRADGWFYTASIGLQSRLYLDALGGELRLSDIYAGIAFAGPPDAVPAPE